MAKGMSVQNSDVRPHWTETAERIYDAESRYVAEDDRGDLWVPARRRRGWWDRPLSLWRPTHWLPYLRSRLTQRLAWVEGD